MYVNLCLHTPKRPLKLETLDTSRSNPSCLKDMACPEHMTNDLSFTLTDKPPTSITQDQPKDNSNYGLDMARQLQVVLCKKRHFECKQWHKVIQMRLHTAQCKLVGFG